MGQKKVSILVLMESGFLLQVNLLNNCLNASFYPCFNGIRVLTTRIETVGNHIFFVSILVLMESGFLRKLKRRGIK